jgi:hypothetical protein
MKKPVIYVVNDKNANYFLCKDNVFRTGYSSCNSKTDTVIFRTIAGAKKRLQNKISKNLHPNAGLYIFNVDTDSQGLYISHKDLK